MTFQFNNSDVTTHSDVIVIGAGLAGLNAARMLHQAGLTVQVLEAQGRLGGRTLTHSLPGGGHVDLGAQWVHPQMRRVLHLVDAYGLTLLGTAQASDLKAAIVLGDRVYIDDNPLRLLPAAAQPEWQRMSQCLDDLVAQVSLTQPLGPVNAAALDRLSVADWMQRHLHHPQSRQLFEAIVREYCSAELEHLSFLQFLFSSRTDASAEHWLETVEGQYQIAEGFQTLAQRLALDVPSGLRLNQPVQAIEQQPHGVCVSTSHQIFRASRVIMAIPPAQALRIQFTPDLPKQRQQLLAQTPMGAVIKVFIWYDRPFWREAGLNMLMMDRSAIIAAAYDAGQPEGTPPALVAFISAEQAQAWSDRAPAARQQAVLAALAQGLGPAALSPRAYLEKDWVHEPWIGGGYHGFARPGTWSTAGTLPWQSWGLIHWAGTETAQTFYGYTEGALASGERAAREVLRSLRLQRWRDRMQAA